MYQTRLLYLCPQSQFPSPSPSPTFNFFPHITLGKPQQCNASPVSQNCPSKYSLFPGDQLKLILHDLELSFGRVDVISGQQLEASAKAANLSPEALGLLQLSIGIASAPNNELPAVIIFERLKEWIAEGNALECSPLSQPGKLEQYPQQSEEPKQSIERAEVEEASVNEASTSLVEMSLIDLTPVGFTGNILDRHMEYSLRDNSAVRPIEVRRRFSDFLELRDYLLEKYPTRLIPRLPQKSIQSKQE